MIKIPASKSHSLGFQVQLVFQLTQHIRNDELIRGFINYFDCGFISKRGKVIDFRVTKLSDIVNKIIPFFKKKMEGEKAKDFSERCKAVELMKEKKHLTQEGLEQIRKIKDGMNRGRKLY